MGFYVFLNDKKTFLYKCILKNKQNILIKDNIYLYVKKNELCIDVDCS